VGTLEIGMSAIKYVVPFCSEALYYLELINQVPGSMGSRNKNVVHGMQLKLGFNTTGTRLFLRF
jgi:hypothetical protein